MLEYVPIVILMSEQPEIGSIVSEQVEFFRSGISTSAKASPSRRLIIAAARKLVKEPHLGSNTKPARTDPTIAPRVLAA